MIRQLLVALFAALALAGAHAAGPATDVNKASVAELEAVKGIGPSLSAKITSARQQGPFKDWADLVDRVSGLGPGNAARLSQAGLTVAGSAYAPVASQPAAKPAAPARDDAAKKSAKQPAAKKPATS